MAGKLNEEDVKEMLTNMKLAAPEDVALVELLSRWAKRGRRSSPEPQVYSGITTSNDLSFVFSFRV